MSDRLLYSPVCLFIVATFSLSIYSTELSAADELVPGIQELYRLDRLAVLKESIEVASVSSYDRTGGNNDGFGGQYSYVRKEKDGLVLADLQGPGVIYRIWTPTPTDDMLEFYFDSENEPGIRVKFRDLFFGKHPVFVRNENIEPGERLPGRMAKPKPEVVFREAHAAIVQIASQWIERFKYMEEATPGQENVPTVLIIVCDNTNIAEVFYRKISGEREEEIVTEEDVEEVVTGNDEEEQPRKRQRKKKKIIIYEKGSIFPEHFSNTATQKRTFRIDSKLLAEAESEDPSKNRAQAAEDVRKVVSTVGKPGEPGEHIRCVISVGMLNEGWDANNVTQVLGIRAFGSQLLCEQVVRRGLRRMDYVPDPETGLLTEEYVDVYGIPFSVIPFKGKPTGGSTPVDKPKNHVRAMEERAGMEMRFPVVEGYAFALKKNLITCDINEIEPLILEPDQEPTATFLEPTIGYKEGYASQVSHVAFVKQDREAYYRQTHLQTIMFNIARLIIEQLISAHAGGNEQKQRVLRLQSRHQLFPQVYHFVELYVEKKVDLRGCPPCELGLEKYVTRIVERLRDGILPDESEGETPLLPILNRYKPFGTTTEVDFKTTRPCYPTKKSHINQIVLDTKTWESGAAFRIEACQRVSHYARNDHLGLLIPYEFQGLDHSYEPDFIIKFQNGLTVVLEIKGYEDEQTRAKHTAAKRWISAVNNWKQLGKWAFHLCKDPQLLSKELAYLEKQHTSVSLGDMKVYKYRSLRNFGFVADILCETRFHTASFFELNDPVLHRSLNSMIP